MQSKLLLVIIILVVVIIIIIIIIITKMVGCTRHCAIKRKCNGQKRYVIETTAKVMTSFLFRSLRGTTSLFPSEIRFAQIGVGNGAVDKMHQE